MDNSNSYFSHFKILEDLQGRHAVIGEIGGPPERAGEIKQVAIFLKPYKAMAEKYVRDLNRVMEDRSRG